MTRLALLADIHGNLPALEAVLHDCNRLQLTSCGSPVMRFRGRRFQPGSGNHHARALALLIRGNHEYYLLDFDTPRAPGALERVLVVAVDASPVETNAWRNVVATWPDTLSLRFPDAPPLRIIHGARRHSMAAAVCPCER
jgi:hypothetical protein